MGSKELGGNNEGQSSRQERSRIADSSPVSGTLPQVETSGAVFPSHQPKEKISDIPKPSRETKEEARGDLPIVKEVNNTFIVGTNHSARAGKTLPEDYAHALASSDSLLLEGKKSSYNEHTRRYEDVAYGKFREEKGEGSLHFLEEGVDNEKLLIDSGVDPQVAAYIWGHAALVMGMNQQNWLRSKESLEKDLPLVTNFLKKNSTFLAGKTDKQVAAQFTTWANDYRDIIFENEGRELSIKGGGVGTEIILNYDAQLRDAKIIAPRVSNLMDRLSGKKIIVAGEGHMDAIEGAVRGEHAYIPPLWKDYINRLGPADKQGIDAYIALAKSSPSRYETFRDKFFPDSRKKR